MSSEAGYFVAFEGTDGAGKAMIAREVANALSSEQQKVVFLQKSHPPTDSGYAAYHFAKLREILWEYEPTAPLATMGDRHWLLLIASWFHAFEHYAVQPRLADGQTVIVDGWYYKYLARFLLKPGPIDHESQLAFRTLRTPDHVILLDVHPQTAEWRKTRVTASESGGLENGGDTTVGGFIAYQSRVRDKLLTIKDTTWSVLSTDHISVQTVVERATQLVRAALQQQRTSERSDSPAEMRASLHAGR